MSEVRTFESAAGGADKVTDILRKKRFTDLGDETIERRAFIISKKPTAFGKSPPVRLQ